MSNPKTDLTDNTQKDPDAWVSGDDPMTGVQVSHLKTLCEQAGIPEMFSDNLTKAQGQGVRVGESLVNFPANFAARLSRDSVYDVFVARKMRVHTEAQFE